MSTYFKPLRRKVGVMTLVLACVFAAGWVRSFRLMDEIGVDWGKLGETWIASAHEHLSFNQLKSDGGVLWSGNGWSVRSSLGVTFDQRVHFCDPLVDLIFQQRLCQTVAIHYWSIVIPLTLLSVWLLLSKPRAKSSGPTQS